jgi:uncharacterized RDD family membrane protein YckC
MVPGAALLTPEAVSLDIPTASVGWRLAARAIDVAATFVAFDLLVGVVSVVGGASNAGATVSVVIALFGGFAVLLVYPVAMEAFCRGRTLGKLAVGLRVVRVDGGPITFGQAAVRAFLGLVEVWATLGGLGALVIFFSRRDQRLGDMCAGTVVLRDRRGRRRLEPVYVLVPPGCEQLVQTMDVGAMTAQEYELVRSFLVRWDDFGDRGRPEVAAKLAGPLWQRFRHPLPVGFGPDYYLACLGAAYQFGHPLYVGGPAPLYTPAPAYSPGPWGAPPAPAYSPAPWGAPPAPAYPSAPWGAPPAPAYSPAAWGAPAPAPSAGGQGRASAQVGARTGGTPTWGGTTDRGDAGGDNGWAPPN